MKVELLKNELAGALTALGKLVSRTTPVDVFRSILIEGKENKVVFRTANNEETIAFSMAVDGIEPFQAVVNFDDFKTIIRCCRNKTALLEFENGILSIDKLSLRLVNEKFPEEFRAGEEAKVTPSIPDFVNQLSQVAAVVDRNNYRRVLQGIHLCPEGIVATNGKEMLHVGVPLNLDPMTVPFPLALLATKCNESAMFTTWADGEYRFFRCELGNWCWTGKAIAGQYPNWKQVIPNASTLVNEATLDDEAAAQFAFFLKTLPDAPPNNPVSLEAGELPNTLKVKGCNNTQVVLNATMTGWNNFTISVNRDLLQRLLQEGHRKMSFSDEHAPFTASMGIGTYVAMPLAIHDQESVQPTKEENKMNETVPNAVTAPMQSVTTNVNPEPSTNVNPLDELTAAVDDFKSRIRAMFDESSILSRKVKEVALAQKQKERDFILAKRAIERIRMAI